MDTLFSGITVRDVHRALFRNIVSLPDDANCFDDLSDDQADWSLAQTVASGVNPEGVTSFASEIDPPFEGVAWYNAIFWPFRHWQVSRFSDGSFGVWYGSDVVETTVYETACHWIGFLADAGLDHESVVHRRRIYTVLCQAIMLDFRSVVESYPQLLHKTDYTFTQQVGARIHREGHPGLLSFSARHSGGLNYALLNPGVLSEPSHYSDLVYRLQNGVISVEDAGGVGIMDVPVAFL